MTDALAQRVLDTVRARFGADGVQALIIYLDGTLRCAGAHFPIGDIVIAMPWDGYLAFVDAEPGVNWGHACAYLAVQLDGVETAWFSAQMPPFLKAGGASFRELWCGPHAPRWAVATNGIEPHEPG